MSTQVGQIHYDVRLDTSKFKSDAREVDREAQSLGSRIEGSMKRAEKGSKILLASVVGFGAAVTGLFTKFVLMGGIDRALNIEDAQAKLRGLGHDTKAIENIMESALGAVKGTAFGLDAAATAAASAVAAGVPPGRELQRVLALTGDTATITGRSFDEAGSIINKVLASNRVSMREINQLQDAGLPILQMLAEQYGVNAVAMREMVSDGEVDSKNFLKAIENNISGAALESGNTTRGAWENMKAAMARVGADIVKDILPMVKDAFGDLTVWFDDNSERIVEVVRGLADFMIKNVGRLVRFFQNDRNVWLFAGAIMGGVVPALYAMAKGLWATFAPLLPWIAAGMAIALVAHFIIKNWRKAVDAVGVAVSSVVDRFNEIKDTVKTAIIDRFNDIKDTVKTVFDAVNNWIDKHQRKLVNIGIVIATIILPRIMQIAFHFAKVAASAIMNAAITAAAWIKQAAITSYVWVTQELPKIIAGFARASASAVKNALIAGAAWIKQAVLTMLSWAKTFAFYGVAVARAAAQTLIAGAKMALAWFMALGPIGALVAVVIGATALIIANWDLVKSFVLELWETIKRLGTSALNWVVGRFQAFRGAVSGVISAISNQFTSTVNRIVSVFRNLPQRILSALGNLGKLLVGAGKSLLKGLTDGIKSMASAPVDAVKGVVERVRNFLPFSPAKEGPFSGRGWTKYSGMAIVEGLADGISKTQGVAVGAMDTLAGAMAGDFAAPGLRTANSLSGVNTGGSSGSGKQVVVNVKMDGIMARSRSDLRDVAKDLIKSVDEELNAKGLDPLLGSRL